MKKYFDLPHIGELMVEHIFYELNSEPILFVCKGAGDIRYLCSCCLMYENWVIAQASESILCKLIDDEITIRDIFEKCSDTVFGVSWDGSKFDVDFDANADWFPQKGAKLELAYERNGAYYSLLKRIASQEALVRSFASISNYMESFLQFSIDDIAPWLKHAPQLFAEYSETYKHLIPALNKIATYHSAVSVPEITPEITQEITNMGDVMEEVVVSRPIHTSTQTGKKPRKQEQAAFDIGYISVAA